MREQSLLHLGTVKIHLVEKELRHIKELISEHPGDLPVKAMAKGEVEFAGSRGGFGNCIMLKHGNGFETLIRTFIKNSGYGWPKN